MTKKEQTKLDKDTRDLVSQQKKIKSLTEHEGWPTVRQRFIDIAAAKLDMSKLNIANGQNLLTEILVKREVAQELLSILNEIEGTAQQYDANEALTQRVETGYVYRMPV